MTGRAETSGLTREELLRIFESAADGVHAVDAEQRIVFFNRAAADMLGVTPEEVLGRYCYDVMGGEDYQNQPFCRRSCPVIEVVRRGRSVQNFDMCCRRSDGAPIWLNVSVLAVRDPESDGYLTVDLFRDVTRRRRAEVLACQVMEAVDHYHPTKEEAKVESGGLYPVPAPRLTRRELDVLRLLASGTSVPVIARALGIKEATVSNHIEHILRKLGVHSRLEAVVYATQHGLV